MSLIDAELARACGLVLAIVFAWAGAAKLVATGETVASFAALGVPAPQAFGRLVPVVELLLAGALVTGVPASSVIALGMLIGFSLVLARALRSGLRVVCSCFGAARRDPVSSIDIVRNGLLGLLAVGAVGSAGGVPSLPALVFVTTLAAVGRVALGVASLGRLTTFWPGEPQR